MAVSCRSRGCYTRTSVVVSERNASEVINDLVVIAATGFANLQLFLFCVIHIGQNYKYNYGNVAARTGYVHRTLTLCHWGISLHLKLIRWPVEVFVAKFALESWNYISQLCGGTELFFYIHVLRCCLKHNILCNWSLYYNRPGGTQVYNVYTCVTKGLKK